MSQLLNRDHNNVGNANAGIHTTTVISDPSARHGRMSIAEGGEQIICEMLTSLGVNQAAYAVRETFSNAYDATRAAGDMTAPIEMEFPVIPDAGTIAGALGYSAACSGEAVIRDHGCGMSPDDVERYFTQYAGSKKRGIADQVGSKGLGSKAPLAVADSFTVVTVKDGVRTTCLLERTEDGNVYTMETEETGEGSGTEVRIPVFDPEVSRQMTECAENIARWNMDAEITVNGRRVERALDVDGYVDLGELEIGHDGDGEPVRARVWERKSEFPVSSVYYGDILLNLAGIMYDPRTGCDIRSAWARVVVACEPGYLNFNISRDHVVDDEAKDAFLNAVRKALESHDFSDDYRRMLADDGVRDLRTLADWCRERGNHLALAGDGMVSVAANGVTATLAASELAGADAGKLARILAEDAPAVCRIVRPAGARLAYVTSIGGYRGVSCERGPKGDAYALASGITSYDLFRAGADRGIGHAVVVKCSPDDWRRLALRESRIRAALGFCERDAYVIDCGMDATDLELLSRICDGEPDVRTVDELCEIARSVKSSRPVRDATSFYGAVSESDADGAVSRIFAGEDSASGVRMTVQGLVDGGYGLLLLPRNTPFAASFATVASVIPEVAAAVAGVFATDQMTVATVDAAVDAGVTVVADMRGLTRRHAGIIDGIVDAGRFGISLPDYSGRVRPRVSFSTLFPAGVDADEGREIATLTGRYRDVPYRGEVAEAVRIVGGDGELEGALRAVAGRIGASLPRNGHANFVTGIPDAAELDPAFGAACEIVAGVARRLSEAGAVPLLDACARSESEKTRALLRPCVAAVLAGVTA